MGGGSIGSLIPAAYLPLFFIVAGYLLGSLPFAIITTRLFGMADPRSYGSGNPGATNVLRSGNKLAAVLTLLGDAVKGWLAVWLAQHFGAEAANPTTIAAVGFAALLGHVFPVFIGFKGGKGVATAAGVFLGFSGLLALACIGVWLAVAVITRYSSLAAICAALAAPLFGWWLLDVPQAVALAGMSLLVIWRHQQNIRNLLAGTESRIGRKKPA
ncbi:1-acyl glycerol-3-phosphate synthetase component [Sterolibacterium denitrificans]|uniref:Glycerol-3-phosphate acyltransferase n=1 Tax=Sterolibacterium denitrificans TaxID=157592 RepID=A0A7Z7HP16_9PROT|nr:glycerol-3-phosphate 1-O-acyltransferase PlsY [Sterolibacterium denitrificans]SMB21033.1 1-acyl glycerol-3-phosphate synthetase component [Sterolibacterium denitrificans]